MSSIKSSTLNLVKALISIEVALVYTLWYLSLILVTRRILVKSILLKTKIKEQSNLRCSNKYSSPSPKSFEVSITNKASSQSLIVR